MHRITRSIILLLILVVLLAGSTRAQPYLVGDVDGNYKVDGNDLKILIYHWLDPDCLAPACEADLDGVPGVSMSDVALLAGDWGRDNSRTTLVINEFMTENDRFVQDPNGDYHDWIELYNYGDNTIDIGGMYLTDDVNDANQWYRIPDNCPEKTTIAPSGYLLIWADSELSEEGLHVDFGLNAGGEEDVGLIDTDGSTLIDSIIDFPELGGDNSYGRFPNGSGPWCVFLRDTNTPPTPGELNGSGSGINVVINEIMYHPYHSTTGTIEPEDIRAEYIELFNRGTELVNLSGWRITDGVAFSFPNDVTIEVGEYLVVAADVNTFKANYPGVTNVVGGWDGRLSNSGEEVELIDDMRVNVDRVRYADEGDWAMRKLGPVDYYHRGWVWEDEHDGDGKSLELINPALPNQYGQNWAASLNDGGTPGVANSVADNDIAPMILDARHRPVIPGFADPVAVKAYIIDELTTGITVTLHYRVDGAPPAFTALTMYDDATHGDSDANDGVYTAQIPAHADGTIVEFYVQANDAGANSRTWPPPSDVDGTPQQVTNMLYQVNASFDPNAKWVPGSQPIYFLIMKETERAELADIGDSDLDGKSIFASEAMSNAQMNATFISVDGVDTKTRYTVGVRNRGNRNRSTPPNNYRVNFRHDDSWKGVTALNLNTKYTHLQLMGSVLFRMAGITAANATIVQVRVNGQNLAATDYGRTYNSYVALENYDSDWPENHVPYDAAGNLYRCTYFDNDVDPRTYADLDYKPNMTEYRKNYPKQTNVAQDDYSDLLNLIDKLNNPAIPDAEFMSEVSQVVNLEQWTRYLAADALAGNREGGLNDGRGDDYAMYRGVEDPRFWLLPHDLDTMLGQGDHDYRPEWDIFNYVIRNGGVDGLERLMSQPEFIKLYYNQYEELIHTVFALENVYPLVDRHLADWVSDSEINGSNGIKDFLAERIDSILYGGYPSSGDDPQIPQKFTINSSLPVVNGFHQTNTDVAVFDGTANAIKTSSVLVNGHLADFSAIDGAWSIGESSGAVIKEITLVAENAGKKVLVPTGPVDPNWKSDPNFADSGWNHGIPTIPGKTGGVGYEGGSGYENYITYDVETEMRGNNTTCYIRIPFTIDPCDLVGLNFMTLKMRYDDGFAAYINGEKVKGVDDPSPLLWNSETANDGSHEAGAGFDEFPISDKIFALQPGNNILAIHGLNVSKTSTDFIISAELVAGIMGQPFDGVALNPGINRITVQTFDEQSGTGSELERGFVDIWYNDGDDIDVSGTLASNTTLDAASGPWHVTGDLTVPVGVTLTVMPGTTVFFDPGTRIIIEGRLLAEGTEYELIRFTRTPGTGTEWNGLQFVNTASDNRITYAVVEYGRTMDGMIGLDQSNLLLDHVTLDHTDRRRITSLDSSLIVRNSTFTNIFEFGQAPTGDNICEHIWGTAPNAGHFIIENNVFGTITGHNDAVDVDGNVRPAPVIQILDNLFLGGGDDALDLEGDSHIEGNVFMHYRKDEYNTGSGNSNVMSAGGGYDYVVVRNVFYDMDHVAQVKSNSFMTFVNNTVVDVNVSALYFLRPTSSTDYGRGAYVDGSIFLNIALLFDRFTASTELTANRSIIPSEWHSYGVGNIDVDPIFVDTNTDFHLKSMSPAIEAGPLGLDMGAHVPAGAAIFGEPYEVTHRTDAVLTVGGPGITDYKYCVNDSNGPWIGEFSVDTPIVLSGLSDGQSYTVYVIGRNSAGAWQSENNPTASRPWTVDTSHWRLVISEVLARNVEAVDHNGTTPDLIELYYDGPFPLDLGDMSISDNAENPRKYVFPSGTMIEPNDYLVLYADNNPITPGIHLGFGLDGESEDIYLYDSPFFGGGLLDSVEFGLQLADLSIGRIGHEGRWTLTQPTLGGANIAHPLGDPAMLKINEWFSNSNMLTENNFIELYNPHAFPVDLDGLFLTDNPVTEPNKHQLAPLSFVPGVGMAVLIADGDPRDGLNHLNFRLSADQEILGLFDADLNEIDKVIYGPQTSDVSQGRSPDGSETYAFCEPPTPGVSNIDTVLINEVLAHSPPGDTDWIELHNTTGDAIDVGGWFLSDNSGNRMKYEIAAGTTIDSDGYIVFYEDVNFGNASDPGCHVPFALSENGETVCLSSGLDGVLTGYYKEQKFGASWTGVSFGRYLTSTGRYDFVAMDSNTPELPNSNPKVGPVVINEIMYNPPSGNQDEEYIELHNITGAIVTLYRYDKSTPWKFTDGIDYTFSASSVVTIKAYGYLILAKDLTAFTLRYGSMPSGVRVLGGYSGRLANDGERLRISMPGDVNSDGERQYICIDDVRYYDKYPWPAEADGYGKSLSRKVSTDYGNDVINWQAAAPSPGVVNP